MTHSRSWYRPLSWYVAWHVVELAVSPNTVDLVRRAGLSGRGIGPDTREVLESPRSTQALLSGRTGEVGEFMLAELLEAWDGIVDVALDTSTSADVVLAAAPLVADATSVASDALDVALVGRT